MRYLLLFANFAIIILFSCQKTTNISGTITDSGTGLPVEGVQISLFANKVSDGITNLDTDIDTTDINGQYNVEVQGKQVSHILMKIRKSGYVDAANIFFENGACEELDRIINPYDAWLKIIHVNESVNPIDAYYYLGGIFFEGKTDPPNPKALSAIVLLPGSSIEKVKLIPGGEFIRIVWDTTKFKFNNSVPHIDSVFCPRGDTTSFVLKF